METETDPQEVIETPAPEAAPEEASPEAEPEEIDEVEQLRKEKQELEDKNKKLFARAKAAEEKVKQTSPAPSQSDNLSPADTLALVQAQVPPEDVNEVLEYARYRKISVQDALKSNVVKTLLSDRAEERKSAAAAHTGSARRAPQKVPATALVSKAEDGDLPETDDEMDRMWRARKGLEK
jgi:hypothetical protein